MDLSGQILNILPQYFPGEALNTYAMATSAHEQTGLRGVEALQRLHLPF